MRTRYFIPVAGVVLSMILAACGSGYAPSSPSAAQPKSTDTPAPPDSAVTPMPPADTPQPPSGGGSVDISISGFAFSPASITVKAGTTVVWTNKDDATHTVASDAGDWSSGDLGQGVTFSHVFDTPGTYTYHCGVHASMKGTIIVTS